MYTSLINTIYTMLSNVLVLFALFISELLNLNYLYRLNNTLLRLM